MINRNDINDRELTYSNKMFFGYQKKNKTKSKRSMSQNTVNASIGDQDNGTTKKEGRGSLC